jgi:hypothetical protein
VKVTAEHVARAVAEVEQGSEDPQHVATLVGAFMQEQPMIGHYVSSFARELGLEGVVLTLLHAHVVARCVEIAAGRPLRAVVAPELDAAAKAPRGADGRADSPDVAELHAYLDGNIAPDDATLGPHRDTALRVLGIVTRALYDQVR